MRVVVHLIEMFSLLCKNFLKKPQAHYRNVSVLTEGFSSFPFQKGLKALFVTITLHQSIEKKCIYRITTAKNLSKSHSTLVWAQNSEEHGMVRNGQASNKFFLSLGEEDSVCSYFDLWSLTSLNSEKQGLAVPLSSIHDTSNQTWYASKQNSCCTAAGRQWLHSLF